MLLPEVAVDGAGNKRPSTINQIVEGLGCERLVERQIFTITAAACSLIGGEVNVFADEADGPVPHHEVRASNVLAAEADIVEESRCIASGVA